MLAVNNFAFPGGMVAQLNAQHIANSNVVVAGVAMAGGFGDLISGIRFTKNNSPTFGIKENGPQILPASNSDYRISRGIVTGNSNANFQTIAGIFQFTHKASSQVLVATSSGANAGVNTYVNSSDVLLWYGVGDGTTSGITLTTGHTYFFGLSLAITQNLGNYVVVDLDTGRTYTAATTAGNTLNSGTATLIVGNDSFNQFSSSGFSAIMWSNSFFSLSHLQAWAYNPWSFWYPKRAPFVIPQIGIQFDAASNSGYQTAQSTYSWSHTCTGSNRYLTVGVSMLSVGGSSVSSITYNGVALSLIKAQASAVGAVRAELWGLVAPATGSNTIAVTLSASLDSAAGAVSYTGVEQTTPYEAGNSATATNVGAADATVDVTTIADNDWGIDNVATDDTAITVGAGQTERNNVTGALGSGAMSTEGPKTPAGTVTMGWTNVDALKTWAIVAAGLRPVGAPASLFIGRPKRFTPYWNDWA